MEKNKTFNITTFGCKVNSYESEAIKEKLVSEGYAFTNSKKADISVFNTCAVTLVAEKKCLRHIKSVARHNPKCQIVALGCFAQLHPEQLEGIPNVKVLIGSSYKDEISEYLANPQRVINIQRNLRLANYEELKIHYFGSEIRAFEKIQDGCDNFCSYCVIPLTRGRSRSRKCQNILDEVHDLATNGYKEIVITGVDMGSYRDDDIGFSDLIEKILQVEPKTFRLRIGSIEASQFDEKMFRLYVTEHRLVPHIHIPLQSGSEVILEKMGRKYDLDEFYNLTARLKKEVKNCALSTDIIVGFPGETDDDFLQTCNFVKKVGFMRLHVFPYSPRPYTRASRMENQVNRSCAKNRVRTLVDIGEDMSRAYLHKFMGENLILLVEEELEPIDSLRVFRGYTENYLDLKVKSTEDLLGQWLEVTIDNKDYIEKYKKM